MLNKETQILHKRLLNQTIGASISIDWTGEIPFNRVVEFCQKLMQRFGVTPKRWSALAEGRTITGRKEIENQKRGDFNKTCELYIENSHPESKNFWSFIISYVESLRSENKQAVNVFQIYWNKDIYSVDLMEISDLLQVFISRNANFYYGIGFEGVYNSAIDVYGPGFAVSYSFDIKNENPFLWAKLAREDYSNPNRRDRFGGRQRFPYPINYLSETQLKKRIENTTFEEWIVSLGIDPKDSLKNIGNNLWRLILRKQDFDLILSSNLARDFFVSLE